MEIATGKFPYPTNDLFKQIKSVYEDDPPKLPEGKYSQEFHYLIGECLKKEHQERPNYEQLLEMDFLKTYQNHDISDFTKFVLDSELVELSSPTTTSPPVIDKNSLNKSEATITNDTDNQLNNMTITNDDNNDDDS